ncbi:FAD-dependent oxidoreductase [Arundinibacter roseus]|uniref:FAD-dependent oxidoreductase n=1 Tax=Arundinibacter roseus TaxID=2070510 RepID=A0A4R4K4X3_9BACT|nr:FAD-dependent oxidoreductase [Arundinibacter roseus]TDB62333.1 FAD-dependent oxidoreductase [Arundinibacter roseus]
MKKIQRRSALASLGMFSFGISSADFLVKEKTIRINDSHSIKKQTLKTDILVVGGGTAGVVAAIQAGRAGKKTILLENNSQLGGTTTTGGVAYPGIFFAWGQQVISGIGWELVQEAVALNDDTLPNFSIPHGKNHPRHQVRLNGPLYSLIIEEKCIEAGVHIRFYETPTKITFKNNSWTVETIGKGISTEIICNQLIDCTGNAYVTSLAGFELKRGEEVQPGSLMFELGGYDFDKLDLNLLRTRYQEEIKKGNLDNTEFRNNIVGLLKSQGDNISHVLGADSTTSELHTLANLKGRASLLRTLRFLRTLPGLEKTKLLDMQPETAVRETYRIAGHYEVTHEDYVTGKHFDDAVSYSYYPIDLHDEKGIIPKHLNEGIVPTVPLRALVPKNSRNLIVAGRCISSDRLANSALRVQASSMGMGQAAAAAAVLAHTHKTTPLEVPFQELRQLIEAHGGIVPPLA